MGYYMDRDDQARFGINEPDGPDEESEEEKAPPDDARREWESADRAYGGDPAYAEGTIPPVTPFVFATINATRPGPIEAPRLDYIRKVARGHATQDPLWISARLLLLCDQVEDLQHWAAALNEEIVARGAKLAELRATERRTRALLERAVQRLVEHGLPIDDLEAAPDA